MTSPTTGGWSAHPPTATSSVVSLTISKVRFWTSSKRPPFSTVAQLPRVTLNAMDVPFANRRLSSWVPGDTSASA
ncbi:MAG: hypothetical protein QM704_16990 [Anaeromyxobacteraceae bacterium]